jgi:ankyrin repeat protein
MSTFFGWIYHSPILRRAAVMVFALAWSSLAIGGEIHDAAKSGDLEKVKALLKAHPDLVNSKLDDNGYTPLHAAALFGHKDVAELLLSNKAEVNAKAKTYGHNYLMSPRIHMMDMKDEGEIALDDATPLHLAAWNDHKDVVELLLTNKAKVNAEATWHATPLHYAAEWGNTGVVEVLLAKEANVNAKNTSGMTPLHYAAAHGQTDVAKLLLANKADLNAKGSDGMTPFHQAVAFGKKDMVELLLTNNADLKAEDNNGFTPLQEAALCGNKHIVELLLANKADVDAKDKKGNTPLLNVSYMGRIDVMKLLLANKAEVNATNNDGQTPLDFAVKKKNNDAAELLRQHGGHE